VLFPGIKEQLAGEWRVTGRGKINLPFDNIW